MSADLAALVGDKLKLWHAFGAHEMSFDDWLRSVDHADLTPKPVAYAAALYAQAR